MMGATRSNGASSSSRGPKNSFSKNGGGLNRSKEALAEREESAELRRLREEMNHATTAASKPTEETASASALISFGTFHTTWIFASSGRKKKNT